VSKTVLVLRRKNNLEQAVLPKEGGIFFSNWVLAGGVLPNNAIAAELLPFRL